MLESILIQALSTCDRLRYDQVGAHVATALDALRRVSPGSVSTTIQVGGGQH